MVVAMAVVGLVAAVSAEAVPPLPDVVLITLDTTRADHLDQRTMPTVWALADAGARYSNAWSPSPLTLPAHASLLTGRLPPQHGLRVNGIGSLSVEVPTLAETMASNGYSTGAVVASLVLDRRFGLDRGFHHYNDALDARRTGEYGYAERSATEVVDAALRLWPTLEETPRFLWVHFYDAHRPYAPPGETCSSVAECYRLELSSIDRQIARLLESLPARSSRKDGSQGASGDQRRRLVVVVGDHGESMGEHGEETHGVFLYGATLRVPLVLSGLPGGRPVVIDLPTSTHQLPSLILQAVGLTEGRFAGAQKHTKVLFAEALMSRNTFGWAPLRSLTEGTWRYIERDIPNSRQELFNLVEDPGETDNQFAARPALARRMAKSLSRLAETFPDPVAFAGASGASGTELDPLRSRLASLGYVVGSLRTTHDGIDPVEGVVLLRQLDRARKLLSKQTSAVVLEEVLTLLRSLARKNPNNVPLLGQLAVAQMAAGNPGAALVFSQRAVDLSPDLDVAHLRLAVALEQLGRGEEALSAYRRVLTLNPRSYQATLALAQAASGARKENQEVTILEASFQAGLVSPALELRLLRLLIQQRHFNRALIVAQRLIMRSPDTPEARVAVEILPAASQH